MQIQLFVTCLIDSLFPEVGESVLRVLGAAGVEVTFPVDQACCGQPAFNAGFRDSARAMARRTIVVLEASPSPVIVPSGSCAHMIRHGYPELFADDPSWRSRTRDIAGRTYELTEFLVDTLRMSVQPIKADSLHAAYHPSCHLLRGLGVDAQPMALLRAVPGWEVERLEAECCGFGGVFSVDHPELSGEMLARKLDAIEAAGVEAVVGCDVSCLMQIEGGLRRRGSGIRCVHIAQVLAGAQVGLR
jgi:L-lactate dehydrogenase complex protein LldE